MQEKNQIIAIIQNYWHFFVIAGLVAWLVLQSAKVTELQLRDSSHKETIDALNAALSAEKKEEITLRKELEDITTQITLLNEAYKNLPTDSQIESGHPHLSPNAKWDSILQPIRRAIEDNQR